MNTYLFFIKDKIEDFETIATAVVKAENLFSALSLIQEKFKDDLTNLIFNGYLVDSDVYIKDML